VLQVVQQRGARRPRFRAALAEAVAALEAMPSGERLRRLELLSYLTALVYHDRAPGEREEMVQVVEKSAQGAGFRLEVDMVRRTIADEFREEGREEGEVRSRRHTLIHQLRRRFGEIPPPVEQTVEATNDIHQLHEWLMAVVTAETLKDVGIPS
jgi:hypothetical protein